MRHLRRKPRSSQERNRYHAKRLAPREGLERMRRMRRAALFQWISLVVLTFALSARAQQGGPLSFNALSPEKEAAMGIEQFEKYKKDKKMIQSGPEYQAVQRVATRLTPVVKVPNAKWEFVLFEDASPNAFALPGGKVGVHTGLFKVSQNDAQLAAVLGHELGHVTARHSGQRITQGVAGSAIGAIAGKILEKKTGMSGPAAQGITQGAATLRLLKFSRGQELQADQLGASYMARAGYDPNEAVNLWVRFAEYKSKGGGPSVPAFMSTHPVDARRIQELQAYMPTAMAEYKGSSKASGGRTYQAQKEGGSLQIPKALRPTPAPAQSLPPKP